MRLNRLLYFNKWFSKPRLPLGLRRRKTECLSLHRAMYTALAVYGPPTFFSSRLLFFHADMCVAATSPPSASSAQTVSTNPTLPKSNGACTPAESPSSGNTSDTPGASRLSRI